MTKNELKFLKNWERTRENGRLQFTLKSGTIWGITLGTIMTIFNHFQFDFELSTLFFLLNFVINFLLGLFLYYFPIWLSKDQKFQKLKSKHPL